MNRSIILFAICLSFLVSAFAMMPPPDFVHSANVENKPLMCESCQGVIREALHRLRKMGDMSTTPKRQARETHVVEVLDELCETNVFTAYDFSPPQMIKGCSKILSLYQDNFEPDLINLKLTDLELRTKHCLDTDVCPSLWDAEADEKKRKKSKKELEEEQKVEQAKNKQRQKKEAKIEKAKAKAQKRRDEREKKRQEEDKEDKVEL